MAVGLCGWITADGVLVGSSGAIDGVMGIATLLIPVARVRTYYVSLFPVTVIVGLYRRPPHGLGWVIRWDCFHCLMLWAFALVPRIELLRLRSWYRVGQWSWKHLEHLLGFGFLFVAVLLLPNAFGLYDMPGNVWECCSDWYAPVYYNYSPEVDPTGAKSGNFQVVRGSGYVHWFQYSRSAARGRPNPDETTGDQAFRVVREGE